MYSGAVYCEQAHSTPSVKSHPSMRVTCKIMGCWPYRDTQRGKNDYRVIAREEGKYVLLGSAPVLLQSQGHIFSFPIAFCWARGVHRLRFILFGIIVIRLYEENNHFSLPFKLVCGTGILSSG